ncbi:MAG: glycosyltransferase family 4 protein [bacterium]
MAMPTSIAIVLKGYPRLSETFIAEEIHALERAGVIVALFSLRRPTDRETHPVHRAIRAPVTYLPEYLHRQPLRVLRAWRRMRRDRRYRQARRIWLRDLRREPPRNWRNRIRRFGQALVLATEMPDGIDLLYAHFLHTPASVARYAATLRGIAWSCSAHAKDIWTTPDWEVREKLDHCRWLTTCTRANFDHLRAMANATTTNAADKVALNYHGLDLTTLPAEPPQRAHRDGGDPLLPVRVLSVGRAVGKKGYFGLLDALAGLPRGLHWTFTHIGDGPLLDACRRRADQLGIAERTTWLGAQSRRAVLARYRESDLFALNCRIEADGDRDGLPNVLVEAQSQALAVASTRISGIPELIEHDANGLLVAPDDSDALRDALHRLITDPTLRQRLGDAGRAVVHARFDMRDNFARLLEMIVD